MMNCSRCNSPISEDEVKESSTLYLHDPMCYSCMTGGRRVLLDAIRRYPNNPELDDPDFNPRADV